MASIRYAAVPSGLGMSGRTQACIASAFSTPKTAPHAPDAVGNDAQGIRTSSPPE